MKVFIFLFLMTTVDCLHLKLFELPNYQDLFEQYDLSPAEEKSCVHSKDSGQIRSIKTDKCIIVYRDYNCNDYRYTRVDNDTQSANIAFRSFHVCSQELGGGAFLDVDFRSNFEGSTPFLKFKNVCGCKNIPGEHKKLFNEQFNYVENHGNGLAVFEKENCEPPHFYFAPGEYYLADRSKQYLTPIKVRSFSPMGLTDCIRLNASVTKFNFASEPTSKLIDMENVTSTLESVFVNNGTAKISQDYSIAQRYKETVEMTKALGWSTLHSVGVDASLEIKGAAEIPFLTSAEVTSKMGMSYKWDGTHSGSDTNRSSVENEQTTTIRQAIEIPPCTEYHLNSYVQMAENRTVDYTATARLSGKNGDDIMDLYELKKHLGQEMKYVRDLDEFAIEVEVKGQMFARYGIKTFIVGDGHPIQGCLQNIPNNSKPIAPKHFEIEIPLKKGKE